MPTTRRRTKRVGKTTPSKKKKKTTTKRATPRPRRSVPATPAQLLHPHMYPHQEAYRQQQFSHQQHQHANYLNPLKGYNGGYGGLVQLGMGLRLKNGGFPGSVDTTSASRGIWDTVPWNPRNVVDLTR